ncbi:MAG: hypothetical protein ABI333_27950 [bacterium]
MPRPHQASGTVLELVSAKGRLVSAERLPRRATLTGWDPVTRKRLWRFAAPGPVGDLLLSADGGSLLATTSSGTNYVYRVDVNPPRLYRTWKRKRGLKGDPSQGLSADGKLLVRSDVRGQVRGYALEKYKMRWLVKGERLAVSRDGSVAACAQSSQVQLRDTGTGRAFGSPWTPVGVLRALAGHSKGRWAWLSECGAACPVEPRPRLKPGEPGCELRTTLGRSVALPCPPRAGLTWSPGGKRLAVFGRGWARIYRVDTERLRLLHTHRARDDFAHLRLAFSHADRYAVANLMAGELTFFRLIRR